MRGDNKNRHGLGRYIEAGIRREVRQRCGFGCVLCGIGIYDYEHFDPDFADATEHRPEGITLLCMQCNQKRARKILSAETVARANANPKCKEQGFSSEMFDFGPDQIRVQFAGVTFPNCVILIQINDRPLLSVSPPKEQGQPLLLSGLFADSNGKVTLSIDNNVWSVDSEQWDVEVVGPRITIRSADRDISLVIRMEPPAGIVIERLDMEYQGIYLRGDTTALEISHDGINWSRFQNVGISGYIGIMFENRPPMPEPANEPRFAVEE